MTDAGRLAPVRPLAFAGSWYDADPSRLARDVEAWLADVPQVASRPVALVAPHAGLRYSGRIAAFAYGTLGGTALDAVVLIGPSHYAAFPGCAMLRRGALATPWAMLPIHTTYAEALAGETPLVAAERRALHDGEHSLELHLPLLARVQPDVPVVPILMGTQSREVATALGEAIGRVFHGAAVVVAASSDLSHFHDRRQARALDAVVLDCFDRLDARALLDALAREPGHACGGGPAAAAMIAARALGAAAGGVRQYGDSGDVSGDLDRVVGYASAVWTAPS
jgi:AmmeMemoRadiSam system protein B